MRSHPKVKVTHLRTTKIEGFEVRIWTFNRQLEFSNSLHLERSNVSRCGVIPRLSLLTLEPVRSRDLSF
uniref:Uncharacterized protein n=1 Tax=Helianthus annuus TaxID=4232 RepID=A0A251TQK4_HELAN